MLYVVRCAVACEFTQQMLAVKTSFSHWEGRHLDYMCATKETPSQLVLSSSTGVAPGSNFNHWEQTECQLLQWPAKTELCTTHRTPLLECFQFPANSWPLITQQGHGVPWRTSSDPIYTTGTGLKWLKWYIIYIIYISIYIYVYYTVYTYIYCI